VHLDSSETEYVIVGTVTGGVQGASVSITQTKDFSEDNDFPGVSGAVVTVTHNGVTYTLIDSSDGVYKTDSITGVPGDTYSLSILLNGVQYTATSTMPQPVSMDSMYISKGTFSNKNFVTVMYQDPASIANYYRFVQYVNGNKEKSIFVSDDEFTNGNLVRNQLNFNNDTDDKKRDINAGDSVRVDMMCIDQAVYNYWYSLNSGATGDSQSASPANPVSNIKGGTVIGYFSAQTLESKTILVK
jgi:hypothetical protein